MKTKLMGLGILAAVIVAAVVYVWVSDSREVTEISGYVGGEKIGLLEDEEVQEILRDQYRLEMDYAKAGSIEMVTADASGRDYLFPSSQTALELYERLFGSPVKSEIVFNTPIVLYTRSAVAQALLDSGLASEQDGFYYVDMAVLTEAVESVAVWAALTEQPMPSLCTAEIKCSKKLQRKGSMLFGNLQIWAADLRLPCGTWKSVEREIFWVLSSMVICRQWVMTCTVKCWTRQ